MNESNLELY